MSVAAWSKDRFRTVRALREREGRVDAGLQLLEGPRLVGEALERGMVLEVLLRDGAPEELWRSRVGPVPLTLVPTADFERLCDTRSPQDVLAVGPLSTELPVVQLLERCRRVLYLEGVQDPGNCGALLRTACALGIEAVLFAPGCADSSSSRVLRAAAGASLRLLQGRATTDELQAAVRWSEHTIVIPVVHGGVDALGFAAPERFVLVAGNEGQGTALSAAAGKLVTIPMAGSMESLNVAAAVAVLLGRWWRGPQR